MRPILKTALPIFVLFLILSHRVSTDLDLDCEDYSCWNGIIMGETTYDETLRLLTFVHGAERITTRQASIEWYVGFDLTNGSVFFTKKGISNQLFVNFFHDQLTIEQIISRIGNPDSVIITRSTRCTGAFVFFKDKGMLVALTRRDSIIGIYPDQVVEIIQLIPLKQVETMTFASTPIAWQGYIDYC